MLRVFLAAYNKQKVKPRYSCEDVFGTQIYLFAGMLPPFAIESEETRASARHCTVGIEPRISNERIILLDTQVSCQLIVFFLVWSFSL